MKNEKRMLIKNSLFALVPAVFASSVSTAASATGVAQDRILAILVAELEKLKNWRKSACNDWIYSGSSSTSNSFTITTDIPYRAAGIYSFSAMGTSDQNSGIATGSFGFHGSGPSFRSQVISEGLLAVKIDEDAGKVRFQFIFAGAGNSFAHLKISGKTF